jgi:hypothetical protein
MSFIINIVIKYIKNAEYVAKWLKLGFIYREMKTWIGGVKLKY